MLKILNSAAAKVHDKVLDFDSQGQGYDAACVWMQCKLPGVPRGEKT